MQHIAWIFSFSLLLALTLPAIALEVPPLRGRINDLASLIPSDRARGLEERLKRFDEETGHQIAVLTIPSLEGEDIESFSIRVAERWKVGRKGFDNGAILLVAPYDRKLRLEVGYGLEGVLPDAIASRIVREVIVPHFRNQDYAGGIEAGIDAVLKTTKGEPPPESKPTETGQVLYQLVFLLLILGIPILLLLGRLTERRSFASWAGRGSRDNDNWGGFFSGGWSAGGSGGGGGGFSGGGGGFGGGGASGSW